VQPRTDVGQGLRPTGRGSVGTLNTRLRPITTGREPVTDVDQGLCPTGREHVTPHVQYAQTDVGYRLSTCRGQPEFILSLQA
jgi:hypothetical protein